MEFKVLFLAHAPDADHNVHNSVIETGLYKLTTYVIKNQSEALEIAKKVYSEDGIDSIILCPGFTHVEVSELFNALEGAVSINVARGDAPSSRIAKRAREKAYQG